MPISLVWDNLQAPILLVTLVSPWHWSDFHVALAEAQEILNRQTPLGFIVDVRAAGDFPPAGFLKHSRAALEALPALPMVFLANTTMMQLIFEPLVRFFPTRREFHFVRDIEAARAILIKNEGQI